MIVSDCDEVLLYLVAPFRDWLAVQHSITFSMKGNDFSQALRYTAGGALVDPKEIWRLLGLFFDSEMPSQSPIPGAVAAMQHLAERADVVILTNLEDHRQAMRAAQLAAHDMPFRVFTNQGPKGPMLQKIIAEYQPRQTIYIDDLAQHHHSASEVVPQTLRLHLCGEPLLAPHIPCAHQAGHAHARIDSWDKALPWLLEQLESMA